MFNQDVQITFSLAVREAQRRHHEFLTTEHVLYAMLFDEQGQEILRACGSDVDTLREDLELYFEQHFEALEEIDLRPYIGQLDRSELLNLLSA